MKYHGPVFEALTEGRQPLSTKLDPNFANFTIITIQKTIVFQELFLWTEAPREEDFTAAPIQLSTAFASVSPATLRKRYSLNYLS